MELGTKSKTLLILALFTVLSCKTKNRGHEEEAGGDSGKGDSTEKTYSEIDLNLTQRTAPKKVVLNEPQLTETVFVDDEGKNYSSVAFTFQPSDGVMNAAKDNTARVDYYEYEITSTTDGKKYTGRFASQGEMLCTPLPAGTYRSKVRVCQDKARSDLGCGEYVSTKNIITVSATTSAKLGSKMDEICKARQAIRSKAEDLYSSIKPLGDSMGKSFKPRGFGKAQAANCAKILKAVDDMGPVAFTETFGFYGDQYKAQMSTPAQDAVVAQQEQQQSLGLTSVLDTQIIKTDDQALEIGLLTTGSALIVGSVILPAMVSPYKVTVTDANGMTKTSMGYKSFVQKTEDFNLTAEEVRKVAIDNDLFVKGANGIDVKFGTNKIRYSLSKGILNTAIAAAGILILGTGMWISQSTGLVKDATVKDPNAQKLTDSEVPATTTCFTGSPSEPIIAELNPMLDEQTTKTKEFAELLKKDNVVQ